MIRKNIIEILFLLFLSSSILAKEDPMNLWPAEIYDQEKREGAATRRLQRIENYKTRLSQYQQNSDNNIEGAYKELGPILLRLGKMPQDKRLNAERQLMTEAKKEFQKFSEHGEFLLQPALEKYQWIRENPEHHHLGPNKSDFGWLRLEMKQLYRNLPTVEVVKSMSELLHDQENLPYGTSGYQDNNASVAIEVLIKVLAQPPSASTEWL